VPGLSFMVRDTKVLILFPFLFFCCQVITSAEAVEYVLKTAFDNFVKGPRFLANFDEFLGKGIFVVDGEEWKTQRKIASHLFKTKTLKTAMEEVREEGYESIFVERFLSSHSYRMARRLLRSWRGKRKPARHLIFRNFLFDTHLIPFVRSALGFIWMHLTLKVLA